MKQKAKNLIIRTKKALYSDHLANHPSIFDGDGMDFSELREYSSGDDAKRIDHKTTAKKQKPFVKIYKSERELNIAVISLLGGSVYFGSKEQKQELIAKIVSIIGISAINHQDRFSHYIYTNKIKHHIKPAKKLLFVQKAVESILEFYPIGEKVEFHTLQKEIDRYIKKRSIIFLIGDFFDIPDLKKLNTKHEVIVIITRDKFEEKLDDISLVTLSDATTKRSMQVDIDKEFVKNYQKKIKEYDHKLYESLKKAKVRFVKIYSDEEPMKNLRKLFMGQR